jgi:S1-C subfamily serine protease
MRPGDVVVKIADKPVHNTSQLLLAVASLKPETVAPISVQRGQQVVDLKVTIAKRPKSAQQQPQQME